MQLIRRSRVKLRMSMVSTRLTTQPNLATTEQRVTEAGSGLMLDEEREKACARPIDGRYPDLAREIRRLMGYEGGRSFLTSRMVERRTGINHSTVTLMVRGDRPSYQNILKFVAGVGGDARHLLTLADYPPLPGLGPAPAEDWMQQELPAGGTYGELLGRVQDMVRERLSEGKPPTSYRVDVRTGEITVEE